MSTPYAAAAEVYRPLGIGSPVPLPPNAKVPVPTGFTGWHNEQPDEEQIAEWLKNGYFEVSSGMLPIGNVALRLSLDVVGVDVDNYGEKQGAKTIRSIQKKLNSKLPATWRTSARQDGKSGIYLYRVRKHARRRGSPRSADGGGVEFIQYGHRFAIVAPSVHPELQTTYQWWRPDGTAVENEVPELADLAYLPKAWDSYLIESDVPEPSEHPPPVAKNKVAKWIGEGGDTFCDHIGKLVGAGAAKLAVEGAGGAHDILRSALWGIVRDSAQGHLGLAAAVATLRAAFLAQVELGITGQRRRSRSSAEAEFHRLVHGAVEEVFHEFGAQRDELDPCEFNYAGWGIPTGETAPDRPTEEDINRFKRRQRASEQAKRELAAENIKPPQDHGSLAVQYDNPAPEPEYIVSNVLADNSLVLLNAQYKAGKTTLSINLAVALASRTKFLDYYETHLPTGNIGIWNLEVHAGTWQQWAFPLIDSLPLSSKRRRRVRERIYAEHMRGSPMDILTEYGYEWSLSWLKEREIKVWIIDPISKMYFGDENDNSEFNQWWRRAEELAKAAGVRTVLLIHHTGHAELSEADKTPRARGASSMMGNPDDFLSYQHTGDLGDPPPSDDDTRYLQGYGRHINLEQVTLGFERATHKLYVDDGRSSRGERRKEIKEQAKAEQDARDADKIAKAVRELWEASNEWPTGNAVEGEIGARLWRKHRSRLEETGIIEGFPDAVNGAPCKRWRLLELAEQIGAE